MDSNAFISILSAFICGGLTLVGVIITIRSENKNRKEEIKLANKPLFYIINPMQDYEDKKVLYYFLSENGERFFNGHDKLFLILKNTDKAIMVINYLSINGKKYYPFNGDVVDKNAIINITVNSSYESINNEKSELLLSVNDSLNNSYIFALDFSVSEKAITGCHEIKNDK